MNLAGCAACTRCPAGIVISWPPGMSAAISASRSWLTWLSGPPATTSVGAVIAPRPSREEAGGSLASALSTVTAQSKESGPGGRAGDRGTRGHGG